MAAYHMRVNGSMDKLETSDETYIYSGLLASENLFVLFGKICSASTTFNFIVTVVQTTRSEYHCTVALNLDWPTRSLIYPYIIIYWETKKF